MPQHNQDPSCITPPIVLNHTEAGRAAKRATFKPKLDEATPGASLYKNVSVLSSAVRVRVKAEVQVTIGLS